MSLRGLTYNNNSGQLSIEYLRPDPKSQFSKRDYPTVRQLRHHVAGQVRREAAAQGRDLLPSIHYVYNDVCKVLYLDPSAIADSRISRRFYVRPGSDLPGGWGFNPPNEFF